MFTGESKMKEKERVGARRRCIKASSVQVVIRSFKVLLRFLTLLSLFFTFQSDRKWLTTTCVTADTSIFTLFSFLNKKKKDHRLYFVFLFIPISRLKQTLTHMWTHAHIQSLHADSCCTGCFSTPLSWRCDLLTSHPLHILYSSVAQWRAPPDTEGSVGVTRVTVHSSPFFSSLTSLVYLIEGECEREWAGDRDEVVDKQRERKRQTRWQRESGEWLKMRRFWGGFDLWGLA